MRWMVNTTPRPIYFCEGDPIFIFWEAVWDAGLVWTDVEIFDPHGDFIRGSISL